MKTQTKAVILVAAMAGLVTGCATHPKHECKRCVNGATSDKGACGSKAGCSSKNGCRAKGNCSTKGS